MVSKASQLPFCSVIVLNYFGEQVIEDTVNSLLSLNYPKSRFEIIIVDNDSRDKSREILKDLEQKYEQISLIFSDKNLGFSKGNNLGIKQAKGDYVALLNNDCFVEKDWLINLVRTAEKDPKIFAVNSRIKIYPAYLKLKVDIGEADANLAKAMLVKSNLLEYNKGKAIELDLRFKEEYAYFEIPFDLKKDTTITLEVTFNRKSKHDLLTNDGTVKLKYEESKTISNNECTYIYKLDLKDKAISKTVYDKIQNAGIIIFFEGSGRDIGAVVCNSKQVYENDINQYNEEREVYAATAGAVLYSKKILDEIGFLNSDYYFYYEDVDICERARFYGYKTFYSPQAIARHLHSFSSKEWSPFFTFNAERGRLMHAFFNFPLPWYVLFLGFIHYTFYSFVRLGMVMAGKSKFANQAPYLQVVWFFTCNLPMLLYKRYRTYNKKQKRLMKQNYEDILSGKWYFN